MIDLDGKNETNALLYRAHWKTSLEEAIFMAPLPCSLYNSLVANKRESCDCGDYLLLASLFLFLFFLILFSQQLH